MRSHGISLHNASHEGTGKASSTPPPVISLTTTAVCSRSDRTFYLNLSEVLRPQSRVWGTPGLLDEARGGPPAKGGIICFD